MISIYSRKPARLWIAAACAFGLVVAGSAPAYAQTKKPRTEQDRAREEIRAGNELRLRDIERRILPMMKSAEYLGPAYDSMAKAYRLKFIRNGKVIFVDVDARTGQIIKRSR